MDILYLLLTLIFFAASYGLIFVCERLMSEEKR
jgi:hypothetical protein